MRARIREGEAPSEPVAPRGSDGAVLPSEFRTL